MNKLLLIAFILSSVDSFACGRLRLRANLQTLNWESKTQVFEEKIEVERKDKTQSCDFFVSVTGIGKNGKVGSNRLVRGRDSIPYRVSLKPNDDIGENLRPFLSKIDSKHVISDSFGVGNRTDKTLTYFFHLFGSKKMLPEFGTYHGRLRFRIFQGDPEDINTLDPDDELMIPVAAFVRQFFDLALVQTGGAYRHGDRFERIDFSLLRRGKTKSFDVVVRTNTRHALSLKSKHAGVLRHTDDNVRTTVPYKLSINRRNVPLKRPGLHSISGALATKEGRRLARHRVKVTIGKTKNRIAGQYKDYLTVTVKSRR